MLQCMGDLMQLGQRLGLDYNSERSEELLPFANIPLFDGRQKEVYGIVK
jgi:hypothetical protein